MTDVRLNLAAAALASGLGLALGTGVQAADWTGAYFGAQAGVAWQNSDTVFDPDSVISGNGTSFAKTVADNFSIAIANGGVPGEVPIDGAGVGGGLSLGYNVQSGNIVWGLEGDASWLDVQDSATHVLKIPAFPELETRVDTKLDGLATIRGRLGALATANTLVYLTGGLAVGHVHSSVAITPLSSGASDCANNAFCSSGSVSETMLGWTIGAGGEHDFGSGWTAKFEYLHYDLGSVDYGVTEKSSHPFFLPHNGETVSKVETNVTGQLVRAGISHKF